MNSINDHSELYKLRGFICEDYIANKMDIGTIAIKYSATYQEIYSIISAYEDPNPVTISFKQTEITNTYTQSVGFCIDSHTDFFEYMEFCERVFLERKMVLFKNTAEMERSIGVAKHTLTKKFKSHGIDNKFNKGI